MSSGLAVEGAPTETTIFWGHGYCILAGLCDTLTGVLLIAAPEWTLSLMRISALPAEPIYVRFIGAFVGAVGFSYLYPFLLGRSVRRERLLRAVLELTALIRFAVAGFLTLTILGQSLVPAWWSVAITDFVLGVVQVAMLGKGTFSDAR